MQADLAPITGNISAVFTRSADISDEAHAKKCAMADDCIVLCSAFILNQTFRVMLWICCDDGQGVLPVRRYADAVRCVLLLRHLVHGLGDARTARGSDRGRPETRQRAKGPD